MKFFFFRRKVTSKASTEAQGALLDKVAVLDNTARPGQKSNGCHLWLIFPTTTSRRRRKVLNISLAILVLVIVQGIATEVVHTNNRSQQVDAVLARILIGLMLPIIGYMGARLQTARSSDASRDAMFAGSASSSSRSWCFSPG